MSIMKRMIQYTHALAIVATLALYLATLPLAVVTITAHNPSLVGTRYARHTAKDCAALFPRPRPHRSNGNSNSNSNSNSDSDSNSTDSAVGPLGLGPYDTHPFTLLNLHVPNDAPDAVTWGLIANRTKELRPLLHPDKSGAPASCFASITDADRLTICTGMYEYADRGLCREVELPDIAESQAGRRALCETGNWARELEGRVEAVVDGGIARAEWRYLVGGGWGGLGTRLALLLDPRMRWKAHLLAHNNVSSIIHLSTSRRSRHTVNLDIDATLTCLGPSSSTTIGTTPTLLHWPVTLFRPPIAAPTPSRLQHIIAIANILLTLALLRVLSTVSQLPRRGTRVVSTIEQA
ncbi:hypothetical protein LTR65_009922 [Meristemomyces frigidus]